MTDVWRCGRLAAVVLTAAVFVTVAEAKQRGQRGTPPPQPPPQTSQQVFRGGVNLVPVDVRVLDREGRPVTDLKEADFQIFENGLRQQIRHFSTMALTPEPPRAGQALLRTAETPAIGTQSHRVFLVVFGRGRLQDPGKGIDAALDLIRKRLLPQDYVGVMAWNRATDLTSDHARILSVVERFKKSHEKVEGLMRQHFSGLTAVYGGNKIPAAIQKEIDGIFRGPETAGVREVPQAAIADASNMNAQSRRVTEALQTQAITSAAGGNRLTSLSETAAAVNVDMSLDEFVEVNSQSMQDLATLYTGISYLRHVTGEKHVLFVTQNGTMLPRGEDDRGIAATAADARVTLSILHTGGIDPNPNARFDFRIPTSRTIADLTGGQFTNVQTGPAFVQRLDDASRFQYTLGYYPANSVMDGRYRRITVRTRPGLRVLYRHGYFARQFMPGFDRQRMVTFSRVAAAAGYAEPVGDLPISIEAKPGAGPTGGRQVEVTVQIRPERLSLVDADGQRKGSVDIAVFCADGNQRLLGVNWDTVEFAMTPDAYERFMQKGMTYSTRVTVTGEPRHVKVVVYDVGADLVGSALLRIK